MMFTSLDPLDELDETLARARSSKSRLLNTGDPQED